MNRKWLSCCGLNVILALMFFPGCTTSVPAGGSVPDSNDNSTDPIDQTIPNPRHATISTDLVTMHDWHEDGSFEDGTAEVEVVAHSLDTLEIAMGERSPDAARTGDIGYSIAAGQGEGGTFTLKTYVEKGEDIRFSFWVRCSAGSTTILPRIFWVENEANPGDPVTGSEVEIDSEWTEVVVETENTTNVLYASLQFEVEPNTLIHIDDVEVRMPLWDLPEYGEDSAMVGGIPVPAEPVAPLHFCILIHIEDPAQIQNNLDYFKGKSAIFSRLAGILHQHGGFLTIQPEEDWIMAEDSFEPGLIADLVEDYAVRYSTHTHGPGCRDDQGRLRSNADCNSNPEWDSDITNDDVIEYVGNLRQLIEDASGFPVTDHNGNWDFSQSNRYSDISINTLSCYKNHHEQRTYDYLVINPWRPTQCNAVRDIEQFLDHDPTGSVVYIPGFGQAITRHHERMQKKMAPMLSQAIHYADADRINTFYIITHIDHFRARDGVGEYISYEEEDKTIVYSQECREDFQYWDDMLTELIDPLVDAGYIQWTSLPEMGELFVQWEATKGDSTDQCSCQ